MTEQKPWLRKAVLGAGAATILSVLLQYKEGIRYVPYRDIGGVPTVCEGITHGVDMHKVYTKAECDKMDTGAEAHDLAVVSRTVKIPLTQAQIAAFGDFVDNEGEGHWERSTMLVLLNEGRVSEACNQLLRWKYAAGRVVHGIQVRRADELQLCMGAY